MQAASNGTGGGNGTNGTPPGGPGVISVGVNPDALALDPATGMLYVANDGEGTGSGTLSVVNTSTNLASAPIPGFPDPEGLAFDSSNSYLFVPEFTPCCPSDVTVFDTLTDSVVGSIPLGGFNPTAAVFDSRNGDIYVSDTNGQNVSVLNGSTDSLVTTVPVAHSGNPLGLAFDAANGNIYVTNGGAGTISVINGSDNAVLGSFPAPVGSSPVSIAVDSSNGYLYVGDAGGFNTSGGSVAVLDAANGTVVATLPVGAYPRAIAVDPQTNRIFVTGNNVVQGGNGSTGTGNLTVIDGQTNRIVGSIPVLRDPSAIVYDASNRDLYVADEGSNAVSVIPANLTTYPVTVTESGLPDGTAWYVQAEDGTFDSSTSSVTFYAPNGTYSVLAESDNDAYLAHPFGPLTVNGSAVVLHATFSANPNVLTFEEKGLANGTYWVVGLSREGANSSTVYKNSSTSTIEFVETNGTYAFTVIPVGAYTPVPASGSVVMNGSARTVLVTFSASYPVAFEESGLVLGTMWSVTLNGSPEVSYGNSVLFYEPNGTYGFAVGDVPGYTVAPAAGEVVVSGGGPLVSVQFTRVAYPIVFTEHGHLASGQVWTVELNGTVVTTSGSSVTFHEPNGTYDYLVVGPAGRQVSGLEPAGTILVVGSPVALGLTFVAGATYSWTFLETGVPRGATWCVEVQGWSKCSTSTSLTYRDLSPGTYSYAVLPKAGYLISASERSHPLPLAGGLSLHGPLSFVLRYAYPYLVIFLEHGLPNGSNGTSLTHWSVTIDGTTVRSSWIAILFELPNGTYWYRLGAVPGFLGFGSPPYVRVNGGVVLVTVVFLSEGRPPFPLVSGLVLPSWELTPARVAPSASVRELTR